MVRRSRIPKKRVLSATAILLFFTITAIIVSDTRASSAVPTMGSGGGGVPVLVIDAGHGGLDGGASADDGTTESLLNLNISLRMEQLAGLLGIKTVMTRTGEDLQYPDEAETVREKKVWDQKARVALINSTDNAVLISVHQNRYPDPRPRGTQVLYAGTEGSAALGELTHANLISCLCPENRRVAAPISDSIYLMKNINCPAILVECGFLSNPDEAMHLKRNDYQIQIAVVLVASYLQYSTSHE